MKPLSKKSIDSTVLRIQTAAAELKRLGTPTLEAGISLHHYGKELFEELLND